MRNSTALFIAAIVGFPITFTHAEATVSILAVAKNGSPIPPSSFLAVAPNDLITAEIYISG